VADGEGSIADGNISIAMGVSAVASGDHSIALGENVTAGTAANTIVLGKGFDYSNTLVNNTANTLMVGFNRTTPSFTVFESSVNIDGAAGYSGDMLTISTGTKNIVRITGNGSGYINGSWNGSGADYAEWFKKEEEISAGDVVGLNIATRKARKYVSGDVLVGICSNNPAFVGNSDINKTDEEMKQACVLVALVGQMEINPAQINVTGIKVETKDGKQIGYLLDDGRVLLRIKE
jgi:hypothetical protein